MHIHLTHILHLTHINFAQFAYGVSISESWRSRNHSVSAIIYHLVMTPKNYTFGLICVFHLFTGLISDLREMSNCVCQTVPSELRPPSRELPRLDEGQFWRVFHRVALVCRCVAHPEYYKLLQWYRGVHEWTEDYTENSKHNLSVIDTQFIIIIK